MFEKVILNWWQFILLAIVLSVCLPIAIVYILKHFKGKIKTSKLEIDTNQEKEYIYKDYVHKDIVKDKMKLLRILVSQECEIVNKLRLDIQMDKVEFYVNLARDRCINYMSKKIKMYNKAVEPARATEFYQYQLVLEDILNRITELIKISCIQNGLSDKKDPEVWKAYVAEKVKKVFEIQKNCMIKYNYFLEFAKYNHDEYDDYDEEDKQLAIYISEIVSDVFENVKKLAENFDYKLKTTRDDIDNLMSEIC